LLLSGWLLMDIVSQSRGDVRWRPPTGARLRMLSMPGDTLLEVRVPGHWVLAVPALVHGRAG